MRLAQEYVGGSISALPTPSLLVDRARLDHNIAKMAHTIDSFGVNLRPHWKTSKCIEVARLQLQMGAVGVTAATANEVHALVAEGIANVFWAYAPIGKHRVDQALNAADRTRLIVSGDSFQALEPLSVAAAETRRLIDFRIEVDTGLGRTGVNPDHALTLARQLSRLPGLRLEGIYTHEGQVQGVGADPKKRAASGRAAGKLLVEVADMIRADGISVGSVSCGSTAGAPFASAVPGITEARPGTYVYGDENQVAIGTIEPEECAQSVLARVVSTERDGTVLVDAGIKAMSSDASMHGDGRIGTIVSPDNGVVRAGHEEHGFVTGAASRTVGKTVRIRPNHACGASNMYSSLFVIEDERVVDAWPIIGRH